MRCCCLLLVFAAVVFSEGLEPGDLEAFQTARRLLRAPGAAATVNPAIDKLIASGDARAVRPLAVMMIESFGHQADIRAEVKKIRAEGSKAREEMETLDSELVFLRRKQKAGDTSVVPDIRKREDKSKNQERRFKKAEADSSQLVRNAVFLVSVRDRIGSGLARILRTLKSKATQKALGGLRELFDVAEEPQALLLVRILRLAGRMETVPHLIELLDHPRVTMPVRVAAVFALGRSKAKSGLEALARAGDRAGLASHVRHALGVAAGRHFATLVEAKAWAKKAAD